MAVGNLIGAFCLGDVIYIYIRAWSWNLCTGEGVAYGDQPAVGAPLITISRAVAPTIGSSCIEYLHPGSSCVS